jgi:hypothetical protein
MLHLQIYAIYFGYRHEVGNFASVSDVRLQTANVMTRVRQIDGFGLMANAKSLYGYNGVTA